MIVATTQIIKFQAKIAYFHKLSEGAQKDLIYAVSEAIQTVGDKHRFLTNGADLIVEAKQND
jgi:hypothetical protein